MDFDQVLKVLGVIAALATSAGGGAVLVQYLLGKRKANVEDKDIVITGAERVVLASNDVIEQLRAQMGALYLQNVKCEEANAELRALNEGLTTRVVALERKMAQQERKP